MLDCGNSECGHSRLKCTTPRRAPASRYIVAFCGNVGTRDKLGPGTTASLEPRLIKVEAGLGKTVKCCVGEPSHGYCC